jgi:DNA-binding MarR family transcriptional regulator
VAFLLAQIGAHAAAKFADRIGEHGLTPPQAGILGLLRSRPGISQQELAEVLGMLPSRMVAFLDDLEAGGYVERVRDDADRRRYALRLTDGGRTVLRTIGGVSRAHDAAITAALSAAEHETLGELLGRIAAEQGLTPGVHPGYRSVRPATVRR